MSKILGMSIKNFKRVKVFEVSLDPDGHLVKIAGRNAQGKSSVLDAITAALGGVDKKTTPRPIRDGEDYAEIVLETEELVVERRFTANDKTNLVVRNHDGTRFPAPQQKLDDLLGKLSLDPLAFIQLDARKQREALLDLVKLPFDPKEMEAERKALYDERTEIGRTVKTAGEAPVDEDLPEVEQTAGELITQIRDAQEHNRNRVNAWDSMARLGDQITALESQLAEARQNLEQWNGYYNSLGDARPVEELEQQLANVEESNAAIRSNNEARAKAEYRAELEDKREHLTAQITTLDAQKATALAQTEMPVPGLGFDEDGVTFAGFPLSQASGAEQLKVSLGMAIALNPELRVIRIADGSLLDDENLEMVKEMAAEHDAQVWIELVGDGDGTGLIIEDGEIKE